MIGMQNQTPKTPKAMSYQLIENRNLPATFNWLFDRFLHDVEPAERNLSNFAPRVDVTEDESNYYLHLSAPGMRKEDFKLEVQERRLSIHGERKFQREETKRYHVVESGYGVFNRTFRLPENIRRDAISATYTDGILTVTLPKDETRPLVTNVQVN